MEKYFALGCCVPIIDAERETSHTCTGFEFTREPYNKIEPLCRRKTATSKSIPRSARAVREHCYVPRAFNIVVSKATRCISETLLTREIASHLIKRFEFLLSFFSRTICVLLWTITLRQTSFRPIVSNVLSVLFFWHLCATSLPAATYR